MVEGPAISLGPIDLPEGILVILDPGLARFWRHDADPRSPRARDPPQCDLQITGPDAEAAGRAFDRQWHPRFLYDIADVQKVQAAFAAFAGEHGWHAAAEVLPQRMEHTRRVHDALAQGGGLGVAPYNGLWSVVVGNLPADRPLDVEGQEMPPGEFAGRWRGIDVVVDAGATVVERDPVDGVMVEHGELLFAGLGPLGSFRMGESLDGLADFVFRGADAPALAATVDAKRLDAGEYGWRDLPEARVSELASRTQDLIERDGLGVGVDYRPHCNLERLNAQVRTTDLRWGRLTLGGARVVGGDNRWGDGIFTVSRLRDERGRVVRVRVELATPAREAMMRRLRAPHLGAIATRVILEGGEPIRFTERVEPRNGQDSGWLFSAGIESDAYMRDARNLAVVPLRTLIARFPALEQTLGAPIGTRYRLQDGVYVEDPG